MTTIWEEETSEAHWRKLDTRTVYQGRVRLVEHDVELSEGVLTSFEVDETLPFAVAVLILEGDSLVLARQYRYPIGRWIFDLPGGAANPGEAPADAAARECREETGLEPLGLEPLYSYYVNPGRAAWPVHLFFCRATKLGVADTSDPAEQVSVARMTLTELDDRIRAGEIVDPSLLIARATAAARGLLVPLGPSDSPSTGVDRDRGQDSTSLVTNRL